jgi:RNA polymerase sigma factor (sigma-70 family)
MNEPARFASHPLMADRARLDTIIDNMSAQIQKIMYRGRADPGTERALHGGESADDILQEALLALLSYDLAGLQVTWEAVSVGIARNKALEALRRATKGRRAAGADPGTPDDVTVVPFDDAVAALGEEADDRDDPECAFEHAQQQLVLLRLAREQLTEREQAVFFGIHYGGRTRAALAAEIGLTPQGVGQMYVRVAKALHAAACKDPAFPTTANTPEGRTSDKLR